MFSGDKERTGDGRLANFAISLFIPFINDLELEDPKSSSSFNDDVGNPTCPFSSINDVVVLGGVTLLVFDGDGGELGKSPRGKIGFSSSSRIFETSSNALYGVQTPEFPERVTTVKIEFI